jgi:glutamate dehydrogenase
VTCYLTFDQVLQGNALRRSIYALDNQVEAAVQHRLLLVLENVLADFCRWAFLRGKKIRPDHSALNNYGACFKAYQAGFDAREDALEKIAAYQSEGMPPDLVRQIALIATMTDFPLIVALTVESGCDFNRVQQVFHEVTVYFELDKVFRQLADLVLHDSWERKVFDEFRADLKQTLAQLVLAVLSSDRPECAAFFAQLSARPKIYRYQRLLKDLCALMPNQLLPYLTLSKALRAVL